MTFYHTSLKLDRRQFLRRATAGMALFSVFPRCVVEGAERLAPNQKRFLRDFRVIFCWSQWAETLERVEKEGMGLRPQGGAS